MLDRSARDLSGACLARSLRQASSIRTPTPAIPQPCLLVQRADRPLGHLATFLSLCSTELHLVIHSHQSRFDKTACAAYLAGMRSTFEFCLPTKAAAVPSGSDWLIPYFCGHNKMSEPCRLTGTLGTSQRRTRLFDAGLLRQGTHNERESCRRLRSDRAAP